MVKLDEKNCIILNLLQQDSRMSLTKIAKNVGLSIDSVKKRIKKMIDDDVFFSKIQLRPRNFGFDNIVDVKIKLRNYNNEDIKLFTDYLIQQPNVAEIFTVSGEWDFSIVIVAKDSVDLGNISKTIRNKFNKIINDWSESLTTYSYKFESYDMLELMGYKK